MAQLTLAPSFPSSLPTRPRSPYTHALTSSPQLLCLEPSSRLSLEEVRTSPWIEKYEKHVRA